MLRISIEKKTSGKTDAISAGGAGAVFWMWATALIGSSTAYIEATLAQLHKEKDALKTASNYQYLTVTQYIEENNKWKADGITEKWNRP